MKEALMKASPKPEIAIDSNEFWSPKEAIRRIKEIEEHYDLLWVEEPARRWDYRGLRKMSASVMAADIIEIGADTSGISPEPCR